jgi:signal transduction histidine kinase
MPEMWNIRTRLLPLFVMIALIWLFFYYSFDLVNRLRQARAKANETIAWFWAGSQVPLSTLADIGMIYLCSECGTTYPAYSFDPDTSITGYCQTCGRVTKWYFASFEGFRERELLMGTIRRLFRDLVERLDYSTLLTDTENMPQVVNGVVVADSVSPDSLRALRIQVRELDRENEPIPITDAGGEVVGYLHYGSDELEQELLMVPYIEMGIIAAVVLLFLLVIRSEMKKEKELSWIGFAKETAHQLSTPLSSLMGWIEILGDRPGSSGDSELEEALECMSDDVERLKQIANRYGQMGKKPKLEKGLVNPVILDTVHYFSGRPGLLSEGITLETDFNSSYPVNINPVLFGWVIENILKNSISAVREESEGTITIATRDIPEADGRVEVEIADTGIGIPFKNQKKIFRAGFTTRRGGWGLGLTLSRRIIERHHKGRLRLKASSPGKGTTFIILLPAARGDEA